MRNLLLLTVVAFLSACATTSSEKPPLIVDISDQEVSYDGETYPVSTGLKGTGSVLGSNKTPIGEDLYVGKKKKGKYGPCLEVHGKCENGIEQKERYIEFHGTSQRLGVPLSRGCIRTSWAVSRQFYEEVPVGTSVIIKR